jgi:nitroreductase
VCRPFCVKNLKSRHFQVKTPIPREIRIDLKGYRLLTAQSYPAVIEFLRSRRSVPSRNIAGPGPGVDEIAEMIKIASRVPDHGKLAPWRFILYTPDYCRRLGERFLARALELNSSLNEQQQDIERNRFSAPVVIAVISRASPHPKIPEWEQVLSAGAAAMNLLIAANAFGWDAQWITEWMASDGALAGDLGLDEGERIVGFVHIGTRTQPKTERDRPELDSV